LVSSPSRKVSWEANKSPPGRNMESKAVDMVAVGGVSNLVGSVTRRLIVPDEISEDGWFLRDSVKSKGGTGGRRCR
jgi:hypothetical protein